MMTKDEKENMLELKRTLRDIGLMIQDHKRCQDYCTLLDLMHDIHGISMYAMRAVGDAPRGEAIHR